MTDTKKTYWFAKGGRRLAQPINAQGWTLFGVWLVALIGGSQLIIAQLTTRIGVLEAVGAAIVWAVVLIGIYYVLVQKLTDNERSPESYWEEQEKARKK